MKKKTSSNSKRLLLSLLAVSVLVVSIYALALQSRTHKSNTTALETPKPKAEEGKATQSTVAVTGTPAPIATSSGPKVSTDGTIVISSPIQGGTVSDGAVVSGSAKAASGVLYYRLKGGKSGQLANGSVTASATSVAPYSFKLGFTNQVTGGSDQGELEVYTLGPDGSATSISSVAVNIQG